MTADLAGGRAARALDPWAQQMTERWHAVQRLLRGVRRRLGLEIAFIAEFVDEHRVFRFVDSDDGTAVVEVGQSDPLEESYCHYVVTGSIPELLRDARSHRVAASLPATEELPVRTHLSVPIRFSDGRVYGTLCCFSRTVLDVDERDVHALRVVADLAAEYLEESEAHEERLRERRRLILAVLANPDAMATVFQPLVDLRTLRTVGLEALTRFPLHTQPPDWFFREASLVGLGRELDLHALRLALRSFPPGFRGGKLNVNVDPPTLAREELHATLDYLPPDHLVVEVTEHALIDDYTDLRLAAHRLNERGIWLAIDDVGSGFSGLRRILELRPRQIKLDRAVVRGVHRDAAKRAMIGAFRAFGESTEVAVLAEGVEEAAELEALRELGIAVGQGFHLGRPAPLPAA